MKKDLDYITLMQYLRDGFEDARPPSIWSSEMQDLYIERLKEFVIGWETTGKIEFTRQGPPPKIFVNGEWVIDNSKIDFIKITYNGKVYGLDEMLKKGWITDKWVTGIIKDIRQKLESRGLL
ncbi:MAG: hypothetical protein HWN79_13525 [Candidatus Lokiarchaeota archaeon]|nr:hypothetical protein [Candidatus Lokiarchaeota archaeon]